MAMSVNTNAGAMIALQNLNTTNKALETTQLRVTTGLKVNGPKDDAATFAIAQNMRGDIAGMQSVKTALAMGEATTNVAINAAKAISDLLIEMKAKVVQANQAGLDTDSKDALFNEFTSLRSQLDTVVQSAEFNGKNLITSGATALTVLSTVEGSTITVGAQIMDATTLAIDSAILNTNVSEAGTELTAIDAAIVSVSNNLASLGSAAKRVEIQGEFMVQLVDILKQGVGDLVDADLAEESASLQSLQIKQQLGVQALSIANGGPQSIPPALRLSRPPSPLPQPRPPQRLGFFHRTCYTWRDERIQTQDLVVFGRARIYRRGPGDLWPKNRRRARRRSRGVAAGLPAQRRGGAHLAPGQRAPRP